MVKVLAGLGNIPIIELTEVVADATAPPEVCLKFRRWNTIGHWAGLFTHIDVQPVAAYMGEI